MSVRITKQQGGMLTLELTLELNGSMLEMENHIQDELNKAGCLATAEAVKQFDADGSPIVISQTKLTARKQKASQHYECPYGSFSVDRFLYQSSEGGYTYCPLEDGARGSSLAATRNKNFPHCDAALCTNDLRSLCERRRRRHVSHLARDLASFYRQEPCAKHCRGRCERCAVERREVGIRHSVAGQSGCKYWHRSGRRVCVVSGRGLA